MNIRNFVFWSKYLNRLCMRKKVSALPEGNCAEQCPHKMVVLSDLGFEKAQIDLWFGMCAYSAYRIDRRMRLIMWWVKVF